MEPSPPTEFVSLGEASRILRVSQETTRRLVDDGILRATRLVGNRWRIFRRGDVERLARERQARGAQ